MQLLSIASFGLLRGWPQRSAAVMALLIGSTTCSLSLTTSQSLIAGEADWPQWRGPDRDGHAAPQELLEEWSSKGPAVVWQYKDAGEGYSAFSIADGKLFTMGGRADGCYAICLSADSGELLWETKVSRAGTKDDYLTRWGAGPRSTPTTDGDFVYTVSDAGVVSCLRAADGSEVWSVDMVADFGGKIPKWGFSESVLIDGDRALVTPGGTHFIVGLDKRSGEQIWNSKDTKSPAEYVSIIKAQIGDKQLYLTASVDGLYGIDAESGAEWVHGPSTGNRTAVIPTPVVHENMVYHTSAYGAGNACWKLTPKNDQVDAELLYHNDSKSMENHHGGVVLVDGVIYGFSKVNRGQWMAQDLTSGETLWSESLGRNGSGSIAYADGHLYCYGDRDATIHLIAPSREGMQLKGSFALPEQTDMERGGGAIWAHPVIANQKLYLRDQNLIYAFDIAGDK